MHVRCAYCTSWPGVIKWLLMVFSSIVIPLSLWESANSTLGDTVTATLASLTILCCIVFTLLGVFNCRTDECCKNCNVGGTALAMYLTLCALWVLLGSVQLVQALRLQDKAGHLSDLNRKSALTALCYLNAVLELVSFLLGRSYDI